MQIFTWVEIIGTIFNLIFLVLVIKENIWCWFFGILGSLVSIYLFVETKLYSEAILYSYYVFIGIYGWRKWKSEVNKKELEVTEIRLFIHTLWILISVAIAITLGWIFQSFTDANNPYFDSFSTVFAFLATYFEAIKLRSAWFYWIVINGFSVWLYQIRGLEIYSYLMIIYFILSFVGLYQWQKSYKNHLKEL